MNNRTAITAKQMFLHLRLRLRALAAELARSSIDFAFVLPDDSTSIIKNSFSQAEKFADFFSELVFNLTQKKTKAIKMNTNSPW